MKLWLNIGLLVVSCCYCHFSVAAELKNLEVTEEFTTLRLTFELSEVVQHKYSVLENPHRVVLDLQKTSAGAFQLDKSRLAQPPLINARMAQRDDNLRIVLDLDRAATPKAYRLKAGEGKPERLVLELRADKSGAVRLSPAQGSSEPNAKSATEVTDAAKELNRQKTPPATGGAKTPAAKVEPPLAETPVPVIKPQPKRDYKTDPPAKPDPVLALTSMALDTDKNVTHTSIKGRKIVVAIDAGHGGKDTGAIGARGVREKDVALAIALDLAETLARDGRYKIVLTRSGDTFIPLKGRRDKARKLKADLFISIHADAFSTGAASGASVFALSQRGATSEMARFLADQENSSDLLGSVGGVSLDDKDEVLAGVLVDLSMTATLTNSLDVGARILRELAKVTRLHNRSVEQAGFMVLKSPDVPSVLVETGFISNPDEALRLSTAAYRKRIAQAIARGVRNYFSTSGPVAEAEKATEPTVPPTRQVVPDTPKIDHRAHGPVGAGSATHHLYQVVSGDTLAKIATRHGVSQQAIQEANGMGNTTVKTGLRLKIPVK